jgi:hypothetical protein
MKYNELVFYYALTHTTTKSKYISINFDFRRYRSVCNRFANKNNNYKNEYKVFYNQDIKLEKQENIQGTYQ